MVVDFRVEPNATASQHDTQTAHWLLFHEHILKFDVSVHHIVIVQLFDSLHDLLNQFA